ncbi:MAG: hypothetical protein JWM86_350 [Thermoleophilia bacterium]|nr:hypothetical protein [Thermoleophilia bacterium]
MTDSTEALRRGLAGIGDGFGSVVTAFHAAVGPELARVATPSSLKRGTLTVRCSSASWAQTLTMMELDLVERLAPRLGKGTVTRIVARAGGPPPPLEPTREAPLEPLDAASEASCEALVADIADPELRARVLAAAKASARRRIREGNSRS